jgi:hypothetical protein
MPLAQAQGFEITLPPCLDSADFFLSGVGKVVRVRNDLQVPGLFA